MDDRRQRRSQAVIGRTLIETLVQSGGVHDTQRAVSDELETIWRRRRVQSVAVFQPLITDHSVTSYYIHCVPKK